MVVPTDVPADFASALGATTPMVPSNSANISTFFIIYLPWFYVCLVNDFVYRTTFSNLPKPLFRMNGYVSVLISYRLSESMHFSRKVRAAPTAGVLT